MVAPGTFILGVVEGEAVGLCSNFGIHWQLLFIQALNFLCVVGILYFFAFKPILKIMEERKLKIESGLQYAEEMRLQLERSDVALRERLAQAKAEAAQIIEAAKLQAKSHLERQKDEVEQLSKGMIDAAKKNIAAEKAKMLSDLRKEVKILVGDVVAKVLAQELSTEERKRYLDAVESCW
ncbi:MAG: F0F1 ATP synthase subunit B [Puniceicoccales bacterium]|jgi:F-type H+-transporting ATPase subunit b|nr:F0F1 ATP synthase subunit B [Puniceicoccales bacterium]